MATKAEIQRENDALRKELEAIKETLARTEGFLRDSHALNVIAVEHATGKR